MQENSIIKQNILKYLEFKGVTQYRFYKENDVTRGILTQNNGITEENLLKFVRFAQDISLEWLLTGEGSMLKPEASSVPPDETPSDAPNAVTEALERIIQKQAKEIALLEIELNKYRPSSPVGDQP